MIDPFLPALTKAKVAVLTGKTLSLEDYGEEKLTRMRPESLPVELGGELTGPKGAPLHYCGPETDP